MGLPKHGPVIRIDFRLNVQRGCGEDLPAMFVLPELLGRVINRRSRRERQLVARTTSPATSDLAGDLIEQRVVRNAVEPGTKASGPIFFGCISRRPSSRRAEHARHDFGNQRVSIEMLQPTGSREAINHGPVEGVEAFPGGVIFRIL